MTLGGPAGTVFVPFIAPCMTWAAGGCVFSYTLPDELSEEDDEVRISDRS